MSLTSSSTLQDALDQYNDNLAWDSDLTKAQNALEAVRWLLVNRSQSSTTQSRTINYADLAEEKRRLERFVKASDSSGRSGWTRGEMLMP
jgi:hypothetical protein